MTLPANVNLGFTEMIQAALVGVMRQTENKKNNLHPAHGAGTHNEWQLNIEGAMGECAVAKFLNKYWCGTGTFGGTDVSDMDVRCTQGHGNRLILHKRDDDTRMFWLVTGRNGDYRVQGWIMGRDGKQEKYWEDPQGTGRHAYFIPQEDLNGR